MFDYSYCLNRIREQHEPTYPNRTPPLGNALHPTVKIPAHMQGRFGGQRFPHTSGSTGSWSTSPSELQIGINGQNLAPNALANLSTTPSDGQVNNTITKDQYGNINDTSFSNISKNDATTTAYDITGLVNGMEYTFQIRAVNESGHSLASESVSETPVLLKPSKPTGLSAEAGDTEVRLSWTDPDNSTITNYQLLQLELSKLTDSDGAAQDYFGYSVAVDVDTAVVGAWRDDASRGSAFVFTRDSSGVWDRGGQADRSRRRGG